MKRPSFQFYPADWRNNGKLRRCSWAARGVWIEVIGLLHDSDIYGVLHWTSKEIGQAIGAPVGAIKELIDKGVLKGCDSGECEAYVYRPRSGRKDGDPVELVRPQDGPVWFSTRLVRDEYLREVRGQTTAFKPSPKPPIDEAPKPAKSDGSTASSSFSSSSSSSQTLSARFARFWAGYPKKISRGDAEKAWKGIRPEPDDPLTDAICAAVARAKTSLQWRKDGGQFIPHPANWLRAKGWEDVHAVEPGHRTWSDIVASGKRFGLKEDDFAQAPAFKAAVLEREARA